MDIGKGKKDSLYIPFPEKHINTNWNACLCLNFCLYDWNGIVIHKKPKNPNLSSFPFSSMASSSSAPQNRASISPELPPQLPPARKSSMFSGFVSKFDFLFSFCLIWNWVCYNQDNLFGLFLWIKWNWQKNK